MKFVIKVADKSFLSEKAIWKF